MTYGMKCCVVNHVGAARILIFFSGDGAFTLRERRPRYNYLCTSGHADVKINTKSTQHGSKIAKKSTRKATGLQNTILDEKHV